MGNQQMTYSSNPLDGTYGDSRLLYQTDNFGRTTEVCDDDSATVVHDILDEIIDSVCHRDDSISDQTRLPPDKDQAPFNPYLFPDQNTGAENSTSNLRNVGYLEREDSDAVNIRNILENSKYEPFKNSNEDVFVDSLEGQYENFTKIECGTYKNVMLDVEPSSEEVFTAVCSERKDSDCLDQKYFQNKENLTSDDEKLESISYHYKEMPVKTAEEDPSPEINEDAKAINENCINKLPLEVSCCSFLQENLQMSEVIQGQLHFSTDFNSNIESHVRNLCNIEEVNEIRSGDDDDNTKNGIFPCSNDEGNELLPKNSVNEQFSDLQVKSSNLKILEQNKEECLPVINSARSQNSSTVEEFANIVKEICSTIEESKPITDEFYYCDSLDDIKESCDKIEKSAPVHENVGSKLEGSTVLNKQMTPDIPRFSDIPSSQEENTTIEQIKTILQDICSSVEETSSNFKQSSSTFQDSLLSKEKCVNDFNKLPSNEKEPIFAEICSTIEEVSSTLKEKCPYIEENERDVKKEIWCASKESYITNDKRVTEEKESAEAEIDAKSFVMDGKCSDSQAISIIDPEQLSKKEMVQEIPHKPSDIHQSNLKEKNTDSFIENLPLKEELATANTSPMHKDTLCSLVEDSYEKSYDKLDSNNKESSSSSTVEEMLSLFKEICSSVDDKVFPEETRIEDSNRENLEKSSKDESMIASLAAESSLEKSSKNETRITPLAVDSPLEKFSKNETRIAPLAVESPLEKSSKNETRTTPLAAESSLKKSSKNETRITPLAVDSPLEKSSKNETRTTPLATESSLEKSSKNKTRITPLAVDSPLEKSSKNESRTTPLATESSLEKSSKNETRITPLAADSPLEKSSKNETRTTPLAAESSLEKSSKSETRITPLAVESLEKSSENKNIIAPLTESSLKKRSENQNRIIPLATESSSLIEEIKSIPTFSPSFEENSEALEHSKPTLEEDISTMDETFQLAPELPLEEISKTTDVHKVETTVVKSEESSIKICEDQSIKSIGADKTAGVFTDSQNIKECQETSSDEFSRGSDNSKDKSLYEGSHICDLDDVISQFRHKHSQESKGSNSQITRTTKFQDSLSTKNKNRLVNNKKLKKLPNSCNNENSNVPLTWSSQTNGENIVEEKVTKKMEEENTKLVEKTEVVNTKESNLQQQSIQECEVTESKKDQENVNNKQLATIKLEENKENNAFCHWSKEKQELSFQIKNLNQTQKITRFIVKELINLISRWMEENHKENSELKETKLKLICERDQAIEDLRSVENAFSDLHRRYEKSKTIVEEYKENENRLKQQLAESALKLKQQKEMYKLLKKRSEERLEEANAEIINVQKSQETEIAVLKAQLRKAEMKANSLEKNLEQKIRENTELSSICEDLIAKVGRN